MGLTRQEFLRAAGLLLAGCGLSETGLLVWGGRCQRMLAQSTRRKLALLVGINQYPSPLPALAGCLTDVELQRELLTHRFGFAPQDIQILTDQEATRSNIETAFTTHLTEQARPGDVVVFHFSGYGHRLPAQQLGGEMNEQNALIPVDGWWGDATYTVGLINDLLTDTLLLLLRSLPTDQITTILDAGYTYPDRPLLGNWRLRSRPVPGQGKLAPAEREVRSRLLAQTQLSADQVRVQWRSGQVPGVMLSATQPLQTALEFQGRGISAGVFTTALTQHLWQASEPTTLWISLNRTVSNVQRQVGPQQQPRLTGQAVQQPFLPGFDLGLTPAAEGVVLDVDAQGQAKLGLGGLSARVLAQLQAGSVFALLPHPPSGNVVPVLPPDQRPYLQLQAIGGPIVKGNVLAAGELQAGQLLQEVVRVLPGKISLVIAAAPSLTKIERVDAISALSGLGQVVSVSEGELGADFLLVKISDPSLDTEPSTRPGDRYGLCSPAGQVLENTLGAPAEAIKSAIQRLSPRLSALLGQKLLGLTMNDGSSRLGVSAALEMVAPTGRILQRLTTTRAPNPHPPFTLLEPTQAESGGLTLPVDSPIRYRVQNHSDRPLYLILLGLNLNAEPFVWTTPPLLTGPEAVAKLPIPPGAILTLPERIVRQASSEVTTFLVFSHQPFQQTLSLLSTDWLPSAEDEQRVSLGTYLQLAQALLADLDQHSLAARQNFSVSNDLRAFDVEAWATLSFSYRVV